MLTKRKSTGGRWEAGKPVAMTLKLYHDTFIRLSALRARDRLTAQEILLAALEAHLKRAGV